MQKVKSFGRMKHLQIKNSDVVKTRSESKSRNSYLCIKGVMKAFVARGVT
jgi:hypothetical protein